ncbi:unnamed protein product [Rhizoctonia solani]|uniref:Uncharacterized protein n=1 Tax=Rhizoctonia solani TaxID=456999 RepID=A0A8H3CGG0_9AGAM|nr:unnamed protein product [Rhizoctonia solani]
MSPLPFNIDIEKLNSYRDLQNYLKNAHSEEENHWRIRSAYKASNLLYRVLKHSIPMYYEGALKIRYYPNRPSELISTPNPSPKLKGITKAIQQDREELMSHEEFEERIKHLARANRYRVPKFPDDQFAIKNMEQIWKTANSAYANSGFTGSKDAKHTWSRRIAPLPINIQTDIFPERKSATLARARARYLWQKAVKDLKVKDLLPRKPNISTNPTQTHPTDSVAATDPTTEDTQA